VTLTQRLRETLKIDRFGGGERTILWRFAYRTAADAWQKALNSDRLLALIFHGLFKNAQGSAKPCFATAGRKQTGRLRTQNW
jgi:hypothetical protein